MKLIGLMPVRNEDWVLGCSLRVALEWCDEVVVLVHACIDKTVDILWTMPVVSRVTLIEEKAELWDEMTHRQRMLNTARDLGATHIAIIDADEILTRDLLRSIREHIEALPLGAMLTLPGFNLRGSLTRYHTNGIWGNRWFDVAFKDDARLHWAGDRFHHRAPMGIAWNRDKPVHHDRGGVLHLWGASERRLRAKHALYKITERLRWPTKDSETINQLYNLAIVEPEYPRWQYSEIPAIWLPPVPLQLYLDIHGVPWQEGACRRLLDLHGRALFAGLDLFGIA